MSSSTPPSGGLKFAPFSSSVDIAFWNEFTKRKLEVYQLSKDQVEIHGSYSYNDDKVAIPRLSVIYSSFTRCDPSGIPCPGVLVHTNTIEEFRSCDRKELLCQVAQQRLWQNIVSGQAIKEPGLLRLFIMHLFGNLKKYRYLYWFAFPVYMGYTETLTAPIQTIGELWTEKEVTDLLSSYHNRAVGVDAGFCAVERTADDSFVCHPLAKYEELAQAGTKVFLCMADPSSVPGVPGWPLRNLLSLAFIHWKAQPVHTIICLREVARAGLRSAASSLLIKVSLDGRPGTEDNTVPPCLGWEKNTTGKLAPVCLDLSQTMDPIKISDSACNLTLQLMRWRLLPELDIAKMASTRCLLFGAGTLGCNVARGLMAWGITHITFVDSGQVSYSNPVRQSLYTFADCQDGGKYKATAAAAALKLIRPSVVSSGVVLQIPMPGHPPGEQGLEEAKQTVAQIEDLIDQHDVVFLLTDSSESRWLPAVVAGSRKKLVITAAVGFDSLHVIRHGLRTHRDTPEELAAAGGKTTLKGRVKYFNGVMPGWNLGCFFCHDIMLPVNTTRDRTLDQQCTVTRPGMSMVAAAEAVELLASILQHPLGAEAPSGLLSNSPGVLGVIPHMVRYQITSRDHFVPTTPMFVNCVACSEPILAQYERDGWSMVLKVLNSSDFLGDVSGIGELVALTDDHPDIDDWSISSDDGE